MGIAFSEPFESVLENICHSKFWALVVFPIFLRKKRNRKRFCEKRPELSPYFRNALSKNLAHGWRRARRRTVCACGRVGNQTPTSFFLTFRNWIRASVPTPTCKLHGWVVLLLWLAPLHTPTRGCTDGYGEACRLKNDALRVVSMTNCCILYFHTSAFSI